MSLLSQWRDYAYGFDDRTPEGKQFWFDYFQAEKGIYEIILANPKADPVKGTVKALAEKFEVSIQTMIGFLDGIDDSLITSNNLDEVTENSEVTLGIDYEKLYMNMLDAMQNGYIHYLHGTRFLHRKREMNSIRKRRHPEHL